MRSLLTLIALVASIAPASAVSFDYTFIVTPGGPAGTIVGGFSGSYTPGPGLDASTITSVNLTINGFTYSTANTLLEVTNGTADGLGFFKLGGALGGINSLTHGTNDFLVYFENRAAGLRSITFGYTTAGTPGFWNTPNFTVFRTPDSGHAGVLLGAVLFAIVAARRKLTL